MKADSRQGTARKLQRLKTRIAVASGAKQSSKRGASYWIATAALPPRDDVFFKGRAERKL